MAASSQLIGVAEAPPGRVRAGVEQALHLTGARPHEEVPDWLRAADIHVLPSWQEGMPNVLLEAMATGLPAVVTPVGGVPEVVRDGVNACLVPVKDADSLAAALIRLVGDGDLRARLGAAARDTICEGFSWKRNAQQHLVLYEQVLALEKGRR